MREVTRAAISTSIADMARKSLGLERASLTSEGQLKSGWPTEIEVNFQYTDLSTISKPEYP